MLITGVQRIYGRIRPSTAITAAGVIAAAADDDDDAAAAAAAESADVCV
jgi:hypothetical protein